MVDLAVGSTQLVCAACEAIEPFCVDRSGERVQRLARGAEAGLADRRGANIIGHFQVFAHNLSARQTLAQ